MAAGKEKEIDFYAILGLKKECSALELRNAYKKLALRWHPDRCSASGNAKYVDESKKKFQAIQEAYSVLSDSNKRLLYDVGVYDSDDDDDAMGDFLGEMAFMMSQSNGNEQESFEDLQDLFEEMFYRDMNVFSSSSQPDNFHSKFSSSNNNNNKRNCSITNREKVTVSNSDFSSYEAADSLNMRTFCVGAEGTNSESSDRGRRRKNGRKQKVSSNHDMSSRNAKISA